MDGPEVVQIVVPEWTTLLAIVVGPILAILVSRALDAMNEKKSRRMDIFRTLMRTRRTPVHPDHVGALNLIEIEWPKNREVLAAWKKLFEHLGAVHTPRPNETVNDQMSSEERNSRLNSFDRRIADERQRLLAILLHCIAKSLNFQVEQLEIFEGGYTPQGWEDAEMEQRIIRKYFVDLYLGRRVLPVGVIDFRSENRSTFSTNVNNSEQSGGE